MQMMQKAGLKLKTEFITNNGSVAHVSMGSAGNFTFYARPLDKPKAKGRRIRGRGRKFWYATAGEATIALNQYASERGWKAI